MDVPKFVFSIDEDGSAIYAGQEVASPARGGAAQPVAQPFERNIGLSSTTTRKIFALARDAHRFEMDCGTKAKNLADTGKKTLRYEGTDGSGACSYNYSDSKIVMQLTDIFQGIVQTMDVGRRLDRLHRFDRLGLDAAMESLAEQVAGGRALELGTILPTLRSIASDADVMRRVRTRANALLATIPPESQQANP